MSCASDVAMESPPTLTPPIRGSAVSGPPMAEASDPAMSEHLQWHHSLTLAQVTAYTVEFGRLWYQGKTAAQCRKQARDLIEGKNEGTKAR